MVDQNKKRPSSGETAGEEATREESKVFAEPAAVTLPEERARKFRTTGFSRMRTDWQADDKIMMNRVRTLVDKVFAEAFGDAELLLYGLLDAVREAVLDERGDPQPGPDGLPIWRRNANGTFVEDWSKLTHRERERYLFQITTNLYLWEQRAADIWGEAMMAKGLWEDAFSIGYESLEGARPTIDDRTARGKLTSRDDKYFALYVSWLSRKADALVRTMTLLSQRLKDVHTNGN
jgi:hypothetical protein